MWADVFALCIRHGVKLIFDEIPSGLGKTGRFLAHEHFAVTPDLVVLGKALGGGVLPIAAVLTDRNFDVAPDLALCHYTHEKNPVTARAALTTIGIIEGEGLVGQAERLGLAAEAQIHQRMQTGKTMITGIRGLGLLRAVTYRSSVPLCEDAMVMAGLERAVPFTTKGRDAIGFSPPLIISDAELALEWHSVCAAIDSLAEL